MKSEIVEAVTHILREKGVDRAVFQEIIESVFLMMIKRKYGQSDNFSVIFNPEKGDIEIQSIKTIVPDDEVEDAATQIGISEAKSYDPYAELGEETMVTVDYEKEFGRRIITSARQHLVQRIREIEKDNLFSEFSQRIGEIVIGDVHQVNRNEVRIIIDKTEAIMPRNELVPKEKYRRGDSIKAIILDVRRMSRSPEIVVSRKHISFVRRLFELEVPEIYDGIVEIKAIAREAGERIKIAVDANDKRIDPVGACVGMKGVRIQAIVKELNHEKIDIIPWTRDPELFIRRALSPVIPTELIFLEGGNKVLVVIQDEQIAQAIGKRGQNIRLASQLTGYTLEPIKASEYYPDDEEEELYIDDVEGLTPEQKQLLKQAGFTTAEEVLLAGAKHLEENPGFDPPVALEVIEAIGAYFEEAE